ncbi:hypothetical protein F8A87_00360 [Betaproteobacteria bacterium SCN2]|jgi:hypothetical protein|nr:hypothetical protein F8A87_00360 [Betaproteobacteria bacterium SCN2]
MYRPIKPLRSKGERGQVAIMVAIVIALLIVMVGLVIDLGYLYTRKTELQNAADASALAGAKALDGSTAGINNAVNQAVALAAANSVDFGGNPVAITDANIRFGNTPDGLDTNSDGSADAPWLTPDQARAAPAGLGFVKVDTSGIGLSTVQTWFIRIAGSAFEETTTYGMAVAGPYSIDVAPIGVCAINTDPNQEYGFLRGVGYNLRELNPINPGDLLWLHPSATSAAGCLPQQSNADFPLPFICQGRMAFRAIPGIVVTNTGATAGKGNAALNSRFGYSNHAPWKYDRTYCTPDTNIKQYDVSAPLNAPENADAVNPGWWMVDPYPSQQTLTLNSAGKPVPPPTLATYGAVGSYITPAETAPSGSTAAPADLLNGGGVTGQNVAYPDTPYAQTSGRFFKAPTPAQGAASATPNRRVLNVVIIDCDAATGPGGVCRALPTLAVGKFFMTREAQLPQRVDAEFAGIDSGVHSAVIQLYR